MKVQFLKDVELMAEEKGNVGSKLFRRNDFVEVLEVVPCSKNFSHVIVSEDLTLPDVYNLRIQGGGIVTPRTTFTVLYRVLDPSGKTLEVVQQTGKNKNLIRWLVERKIFKKHGKKVTIQQIKVTEEA